MIQIMKIYNFIIKKWKSIKQIRKHLISYQQQHMYGITHGASVNPAIVHKWSVDVLKRTAVNTILERLDKMDEARAVECDCHAMKLHSLALWELNFIHSQIIFTYKGL